MKVQPNFDLLLVQPVKIDKVTSSGVVVAGTSDESGVTMILAKVIVAGPSVRPEIVSSQFEVKAGDYIILPGMAAVFPLKYSPIALVSRNEKLPDQMLCRTAQVLAIVQPEEGEVFPDGTLPELKLGTS